MRSAPRASTAWTALLALLGALALTASAAPALADVAVDEVAERPADGVFAIAGHGWGHGRGMSQWGAQGAASNGVSAETIVSTYYPGTTRTVLSPAPIRVVLQGDEGSDTHVYAAEGLVATDVASGTRLELPAGPTRWRVVVDASGLHLQSLTGTTWTAVAIGGATTHTGPVRFSGPTFVRVAYPNGSSRDYRGAVQAVKTGAVTLASVVVLSLEDYLLGVVPREAPSSWKPAALQAQAIAARSYSANKRERVAGAGSWDICDTTQCQVFGGSRAYTASGAVSELEPATTSQAVRDTAGVVRTFGGKSIFAEFSSSNGGWSTKGDFAYLAAQRDDWDGLVPNSVHRWTAALRATDLERRFPAVGTLTRLRVTARDGNGEWGGRVRAVVLEGVDAAGAPTRVQTTGAGVYNARTWPASSDGLKSSWWRVTNATAGPTPAPAPSPTAAPAPAGDLASVVTAQSAAPTLVRPPGKATGTLTASLKNTGSAAWPVNGLHLTTASPAGQADPLVAGSTRPGAFVRNASRPGATSVAPGEVADFSFALDATGVEAGTLSRSYRLRTGTAAPFGATVSWQVVVQQPRLTAARAAAPVAVQPPSTAGAPPAVFADGRTVVLPRNGSTRVRLTLTATGNLTWAAGSSSPVQLGTSQERNRESISAGRDWSSPTRATKLRGALDGSTVVRPGQSGTFDLELHGNSQGVGINTEVFEPLWAGVGWLEGAATALDVVRVDPAVARLAMLHTAPAPTLALDSGRPGTLVVRLRNLGGQAWQVGQERLGTVGDRRSELATEQWDTPSRTPALAANVDRPGVTAVFPGEVGEWRVPVQAGGGTYHLALQAVGAGVRYGPVLTSRVTISGPRAPWAQTRTGTFKGSGPGTTSSR